MGILCSPNAFQTPSEHINMQKTPRTKQNSIDYIERNFKKYQKYMELPISDKCCDKLKKEPLRRKAKELGMECVILGILASESYQREKGMA